LASRSEPSAVVRRLLRGAWAWGFSLSAVGRSLPVEGWAFGGGVFAVRGWPFVVRWGPLPWRCSSSAVEKWGFLVRGLGLAG
jgi:hypothetical protein